MYGKNQNRIFMKILLTNDDGYMAKGIAVMASILKESGDVTVLAPKSPQSGMSMAVSMGGRPLAYRNMGMKDGVKWSYLDATPASCVKLALNTVFSEEKPDVVVSGINHGTNAASAVCYSGTLGAAAEAALCGIPAIGVSLDTCDPDADFTSVEKYFPEIFRKLLGNQPERPGIYYNINFPENGMAVRGVRIAVQGRGRWIREFMRYEGPSAAGPGEELFVITGEFQDDPNNPENADHRLNRKGYITVVPHRIDCTDYSEADRLRNLEIENIIDCQHR